MARDIKHKKSTLHERKTSLDSIKQLMSKSPSRAKADLLRHLEKYPEDMYAWHYYGKLSQTESNFSEAEYAFTKVAESRSWNKYAGIVGLGDIARHRGQRDLARKYYHRAIKENSNEKTHTFCLLARVECVDGNYDEALRVLELAKEQNNEVLIEKMRVHVIQEDEEAALAIADKIHPTSDAEKRTIIYEKAKLAIAANRIPEAKYLLMQAKEIKIKDSEYYKILNTEAILATELGEIQLAIDNCEEAIADGMSIHGDIYVTLGRAKQLQGDFQEGLRYHYLAAEAKGSSHVTRQASLLYASMIELAMGNEKKAEENLVSSLSCDKQPYESSLETLCGIYYRQGRYSEIEQLLSKYSSSQNEAKLASTLSFVKIILDAATGKELPQRHGRAYRERQAIKYSREEALEHIITRHQGTDTTAVNFAANIDIAKLYDEVKPLLTDDAKVASDMMDKYVIDYPNVGISPTDEIVHQVGIITLPGTHNIVTMYPDSDAYLIRKSDVRKAVEKQKVKSSTNSRIARFNNRFANFQTKQ